jgi:hypothetical protein
MRELEVSVRKRGTEKALRSTWLGNEVIKKDYVV